MKIQRNPELQDIRKNAAALCRDIRGMFPTLCGNWTRREWNQQARIAARHHVVNSLRFIRANKGK